MIQQHIRRPKSKPVASIFHRMSMQENADANLAASGARLEVVGNCKTYLGMPVDTASAGSMNKVSPDIEPS